MIIIRASLVRATLYTHLTCDPTMTAGTSRHQAHVLIRNETVLSDSDPVADVVQEVKCALLDADAYAGDLLDHLRGECVSRVVPLRGFRNTPRERS